MLRRAEPILSVLRRRNTVGKPLEPRHLLAGRSCSRRGFVGDLFGLLEGNAQLLESVDADLGDFEVAALLLELATIRICGLATIGEDGEPAGQGVEAVAGRGPHGVEAVETEDPLEHLVAIRAGCLEEQGELVLSQEYRAAEGVEVEPEQVLDALGHFAGPIGDDGLALILDAIQRV